MALPRLIAALAAPVFLGLASCDRPPPTPDKSVVVLPPPPGPPLPVANLEAAKARMSPDNTPQPLSFFRDGSTTVQGTVLGYKAPAYVVPVAAGQTLTVELESPSSNIYFNVVDAQDASGAAVFRGEVDGGKADIKAAADTTYLVTPFQPRAMARRGESITFLINIARRSPAE